MLGFLFSPNGRVSRKGYWLGWTLPSALIAVVASIIDAASGEVSTGTASALATLLTAWPNFAITVKRYHDRGMSGWWVLWSILIVLGCLFPVFAATEEIGLGNIINPWLSAWIGLYCAVWAVIAFALVVYFLPGERGANRYGADPLGARKPGKPRIDPAVEFPGPWTAPITRTGRPSTESPSHRHRRPPRST